MDWKAHALILQVQIQMNKTSTTDLIDWGVTLLTQGIETAAVLRLASAYAHESRYDLELVFAKALTELKLVFPKGDELLKDYALLIAKQVIEYKRSAESGLELLCQINYQRHEWDSLLRPLCDLHAAVELSADHMQSYLYPEFDLMPLDDLIRAECQFYLDLSQFGSLGLLPADLLNSSYCLHCEQRIMPVQAPEDWLHKTWRRVMGNQQLPPWMCPNCQNTRFLSLMTMAGRKRFFDSLSKFKT